MSETLAIIMDNQNDHSFMETKLTIVPTIIIPEELPIHFTIHQK